MLKSLDIKTAQIYKPIKGDLIQVKENLKGLKRNQDKHMAPLLTYLFGRGGKGMRPAVTLLASGLYGKGGSSGGHHGNCGGASAHSDADSRRYHRQLADAQGDGHDQQPVGRKRGNSAGRLCFRRIRHVCLRHEQHPGDPTVFRDNHGPFQRTVDGVFQRSQRGAIAEAV